MLVPGDVVMYVNNNMLYGDHDVLEGPDIHALGSLSTILDLK